jgi:hypothetical protein
MGGGRLRVLILMGGWDGAKMATPQEYSMTYENVQGADHTVFMQFLHQFPQFLGNFDLSHIYNSYTGSYRV